MFRHKLLHHLFLPPLVACRSTQCFLLIIPHHLFYHPPCLGVEVRERRRSRIDLCGVDGRVMRENVGPPLGRTDVESFGNKNRDLVDRYLLRDETNDLREFVKLDS